MNMHPDIGLLNGGKCYVFLEGYGLNREPLYGTYEECLNFIEAHGGVEDPIPTDDGYTIADYKAAHEASKRKSDFSDAPAPAATKKAAGRGGLRDYTVSIEVAEKIYAGASVIDSYEITVSAYDNSEAAKKGRDAWRENVGAYGPKAKVRARLAH